MTEPAERGDATASVSAALIVIYTQRLDECRYFYADLGLPLVREQHGQGPVHYAAELAGGLVLELYPGRPERVTGRLRLGFTVPATETHPPGHHTVTDPDGRVVELHAVNALGRYKDQTPMPRPKMPEGATWEGGRGGARARQFEPGDAWTDSGTSK